MCMGSILKEIELATPRKTGSISVGSVRDNMKVEPMKIPPMCKCNHSVNWHKGANSECDFPKCECGGYKEK